MGSRSNNLRKLGEFEIDLDKKILWVNETPSALPSKAVELLCVLIENEGDVLSKDDLLKKVWQDSFVEEGVLPQNIYTLRKLFRQYGLDEDLIQTVPRRGYRFVGAGSANTTGTEITIERETVHQTYVSRTESIQSSPDTGKRSARSRIAPFAAIATAAALILGLGAIAWTTRSAETKKPQLTSIAVAPFAVIYDSSEASSVAQRGVAESTIFWLNKIRDIEVSEFKQIESYFGSTTDPSAIASGLGFDSVLTGTVRNEGGTVRLAFELRSVADGKSLISESLVIRPPSTGTHEKAIALRIARKVEIYVAELRDAASVPQGTLTPEALEAYILAQKMPREFDLNRGEEAVELLRKVVDAAPTWATGHAKLAQALTYNDSSEDCIDAAASATAALELDPKNSTAYLALGYCAQTSLDWSRAEAMFRKAVESDLTSSRANIELGQALSLQRRFSEAEAYLNKGLEIDPLFPYNAWARCSHFYYDMKWDRAINDCETAEMLEPGYVLSKKRLHWIYAITGRWDKVIENTYGESVDEKLRRDPYVKPLLEGDIEGYWRINLAARKGNTRRQPSPLATATFHSILGETEQAMDLIEQAAREKHYQIRYINADPIWDGVRRNPRFQKLMLELGFSNSGK